MMMIQDNDSNSPKNSTGKKDSVTLAPEVTIGKELIDTLDNVLNKGDWDSSLFLRTVKRRIQLIIDETKNLIEEEQQITANIENNQFNQLTPPGYVRVYILLYQADGNKLANWQYALKTLLEYNVSRPTYRDESHVQELIRSKKDIERYGYAVVNIRANDIYTQTQQPKDAFNHEMTILKENSIKRENIVGFVHANKKRYGFVDSELTYHSEVE